MEKPMPLTTCGQSWLTISNKCYVPVIKLCKSNTILLARGGQCFRFFHPNGLLIPSDWKWPLESTSINFSYADFMDKSIWDNNWFLNLSDPTNVWDPENADCNWYRVKKIANPQHSLGVCSCSDIVQFITLTLKNHVQKWRWRADPLV